MVAENISLGVLALPQAVAWLGIVPGLLLIFLLGVIAGYTGLIIGQFKQAFPQVVSFADCGELIAGPIGREIMAISQILILIFIMAAHVLSFAIAMNVMTDHSLCTVAFAAFGLLICFILGLPRTLKGVSYLSIFCKSHIFSNNRTSSDRKLFSMRVYIRSSYGHDGFYRNHKARHGSRRCSALRNAYCGRSHAGDEHDISLWYLLYL